MHVRSVHMKHLGPHILTLYTNEIDKVRKWRFAHFRLLKAISPKHSICSAAFHLYDQSWNNFQFSCSYYKNWIYHFQYRMQMRSTIDLRYWRCLQGLPGETAWTANKWNIWQSHRFHPYRSTFSLQHNPTAIHSMCQRIVKATREWLTPFRLLNFICIRIVKFEKLLTKCGLICEI